MLIEGASQSRVPRIIGRWRKDNFDLWKLWALEGRPVDMRVGELCISVLVYLCVCVFLCLFICVFVTNTCWREGLVGELLDELQFQARPCLLHPLPENNCKWTIFGSKHLGAPKHLMVFSNCTMSVVGVIRMSKVNSNLKVGFRSRLKAKIYAVLVWNHIGLDPSIDNGQIYSGDVSKCLAGVCL